jgi:hypothetical protein
MDHHDHTLHVHYLSVQTVLYDLGQLVRHLNVQMDSQTILHVGMSVEMVYVVL